MYTCIPTSTHTHNVLTVHRLFTLGPATRCVQCVCVFGVVVVGCVHFYIHYNDNHSSV